MIGQNIRNIRKALGYSQDQFATELGLSSKKILSNYENKITDPPELFFMKLKRRVGFTEEDLRQRKLDLEEIEKAIRNYKRPQHDLNLSQTEISLRLIQLETAYKVLLEELASLEVRRLSEPDQSVIERLSEITERRLEAVA